jgi:hypothetical protein
MEVGARSYTFGAGASPDKLGGADLKDATQQQDKESMGQQIWRAVGGDAALSSSKSLDPQTSAVLINLKGLLSSSRLWQIRHSDEGASASYSLPSAGPNDKLIGATAADRAAGGGSSLPWRLQDSALAAAGITFGSSFQKEVQIGGMSFFSTPSKASASADSAQRLAAERLESERLGVTTDNERALVERLRRCEAREAYCEQRVAVEQSRVAILSADLQVARQELEAREKESKAAEDLRARELQTMARMQCLESMHEDVQREMEAVKLQRHVTEVDLSRTRSELLATTTQQKALEHELQSLKERPPKGPKPACQKRAAGGKLLDRFDLASRSTLFASPGSESSHLAQKLPQTPKSSTPGMFWGCCSGTTKASKDQSDSIKAKAPEPASKT